MNHTTGVLKQCWERIYTAQEHIRAVEAARDYVLGVTDSRTARDDLSGIREALIDVELRWWRELAMWGLTLPEKERDRVKAAVHDRFLARGVSVSHWLTKDGRSPGMWACASEEEFRELARAAFAPKPR